MADQGNEGGAAGAAKRIRNPQDFYGGLVLALFSLFAFWAGSDLPGMQGFAFGPGTAPRLFAGLLLAMSIVIMLIGYFTDGPDVPPYAIRGPLLVIAAVLFFALTIRSLGLVVTTFVTIMIAAPGSSEIRWLESVIWAAALTLFCSLLFPYALSLPLQLWPQALY